MANLEIKVETGDAADKLAAVAESIDKAAAAADKAVPSFDKLDEAAKKAADVKPIDQAVPDSIDKTGEAAKKLGEAAPGVDSAAAALHKVGETAGSLSSAAASAEQAAAAIEKTAEASTKAGQASEGLGRFAENASKAGESSRNTEAATASLDAAFQSIGQKALNAAEHMTGFGTAAGAVSNAFSTIMSVGGGLPGILAGIATAIAAIDFSRISEEALKAAMQVENLQRALNVWSKDARQAPEALEILDKTADRLGLNLEKLEQNFGKFASTAMSAGFSAKFAATAFDAVENAARSSGQGMAGAQRVLNTLDIWMANGTMTAGMLGRSLKEVGMTLDQIDPKFKGLSRNTVLPVEAFNKLLVAMSNIATVSLTLQEQTERVANSWTMMLAAFGRGQMDSEVASMKVLADTMHHAQSELNSFAFVAGELWGILQSVFNYIEAAAVGAFGGLIDAVRTVWNELSKASFVADDLKAAWAGIAQGAGMLGDALGPLAHEILPTLKVLAQSFVLGLYALNAAFREAGEDVGILAGAIAGMLYLAFFKVIDAIKSFIDWMNSGLEAMKSWMSSGLPEWLSGPLTTAIEKVQGFFRSIRDEWNEGVAAASAARNATDQLAEAERAAGEAAAKAAQQTKQATLENEKLAVSAQKATEAEIAKRAAMIFAEDRVWNGGTIYGGGTPSGMQDYFNKYEKQNGQGGGQGHGGGGGYGGGGGGGGGGDSFWYSQRGPNGELLPTGERVPVNSPDWSRAMGAMYNPDFFGGDSFNGNTMAFGDRSQPGNRAALALLQKLEAESQAAMVRQSTEGVGLSQADFNQQQGAQFAAQLEQGLKEALNGSDLVDALAQYGEQIGNAANADKTWADVVQKGAETFDQGNRDLMTAIDQLNSGVGSLDQSVQANSAATEVNTTSVYNDSFWTEQSAIATEANTAATQADTQANYVDAAAQSSSSSSSGNVGGGGGPIDQGQGQGAQVPYMDTGGIVGQWGGRMGPAIGSWKNAPHFASGGTTGGGIPIVAHPNEAIIPLQGGAVPVHLNGQGFADLVEKNNAIGTVAHEDADRMIDLLQKIANRGTDLLTAFNIVAAKMEQAAARSSSGSISSAGSAAGGSYIAAGDAGGGNGGSLGEGAGSVIRGFYGTSNHGGYLHPSVLQSKLAELHMMGQDKALDNYSKYVGGAADGLENTNMLPGMNRDGVQLTVHPNEAIIPLPDGRSVPVHFTGERGGGMTNQGVRGTVINHYTNNRITVPDTRRYASRDQEMQRLLDNINRSTNTIGRTSQVDDPTMRQVGGTMTRISNPGVRGGPIV